MLKYICLHILKLTGRPAIRSSLENGVETKRAGSSEVRQTVFNGI